MLRTQAAVARQCWRVLLAVILVTSRPVSAVGQAARDTTHGGAPSASEVGAKLANPLGGVWAIFTENDLFWSDGDINAGSALAGGRVVFQPILPIPLYGTDEKKQWMFITRPILPVLLSQPVPLGPDRFSHLGGLADMQLPMVVKPPLGKFMLAVGPTWLFPTATRGVFGGQQWGVGPAVVLGYATKAFTGGFFPQYHWGFGGWRDASKPDVSTGSILVWFSYNLPGAWTVGTNPTITYDHTVTSGNRWNVPVGPQIGKTTQLGKMHVNFRLAAYYSAVHQDVFGQRWLITLNVIPVIPSLIKRPLLGGGKPVPPTAAGEVRR
jgi:hypothetical protein